MENKVFRNPISQKQENTLKGLNIRKMIRVNVKILNLMINHFL